ncbi:MAG: YkgJ family cysteine cluster protein [Proteobacteria bacterium]|nr:YkgJ family cysteine cluster protein [Pseudomonadota bacterium]
MNNDSDFKNYRQLLSRVDEKFSAVMARYPSSFQCRRGCFGCCKSGLTVTNVEARHIENWLASNPAVALGVESEAHTSERGETNEDEYCAFLNQDGGCSIYEVRPIV